MMPPKPLSKQQKAMLDFIVEFMAIHDYAPSYREIAEHFGLTSVATVYEHIKNLEDKGYLKNIKGEPRGLRPAERTIRLNKALELPLVGIIAAGQPIEAIQEYETIAVPFDLINSINSFVLKVKGDSMIEDGIFDGDYVVVERNYYPKNGDIVVALLDNENATLKRYYREKTRIRLQPANSNMQPIFVKNPAIQGIVRAVMRRY